MAGVIPQVVPEQFIEWFDLMGLQRHIKVLGIFARLDQRDGKPAYLDDLPLVLYYVHEALALYRDRLPTVGAFFDWFESLVMPRAAEQPWFRPIPPDAPPP